MAYSTANLIAKAIKYCSFSDNSEEDGCQLLAYPEFTERFISIHFNLHNKFQEDTKVTDGITQKIPTKRIISLHETYNSRGTAHYI
jgi:hypothetical protein